MFEYLFVIKLAVAISVVLGLSIVTERISPKLAGILAGIPTGSAITLFFIGLENGTDFASQAALYNMIGIIAMQALLFAYYKASITFKGNSLVLSSILSVTGYLIVIYLLQFLPKDIPLAVLLPLASIFLFTYLFRKIENTKITERIKLSPAVVLARAIAAAAIILAVTEVAGLVGPKWAGLLTAFPTTTFPLLLIVHYTYDVKHVHTIIKNFPVGLASLIAYSLTISLAFPLFGVFYGTLAAFLSALIICVFIYFIQPGKNKLFE
jgi:uncharacterized membrane protein (GlpM family)